MNQIHEGITQRIKTGELAPPSLADGVTVWQDNLTVNTGQLSGAVIVPLIGYNPKRKTLSVVVVLQDSASSHDVLQAMLARYIVAKSVELQAPNIKVVQTIIAAPDYLNYADVTAGVQSFTMCYRYVTTERGSVKFSIVPPLGGLFVKIPESMID